MEVLGDLKIAEMSPPSSRFRGSEVPFLAEDTSLEVSAGSHVPEDPVV